METIPKYVRDLVTRFNDRHWQLLSMIARCGKPAVELLRSNPALGYMLANNWVFHKPAVKKPIRAIRGKLKRKQKQILKWLGFPGTNTMRRILEKIPHYLINIQNLLYLRDAFRDTPECIKMLSYVPRINTQIFKIVSYRNLFEAVTPKLFREVSCMRPARKRYGVYYHLRDTVRIRDRIARYGEGVIDLKLQSAKHIYRIHDELVQQHNLLVRTREMPDVALAENDLRNLDGHIEAIRTSKELMKEGDEMHHCVGSYVESAIVNRRFAYFRVLAPERCTLEVSKNTRNWEINQIHTSGNGIPTEQTIDLVKRWLKSQNDPSTDKVDTELIEIEAVQPVEEIEPVEPDVNDEFDEAQIFPNVRDQLLPWSYIEQTISMSSIEDLKLYYDDVPF